MMRSCHSAARWGLPGAALVLLPKCPMCLAAYVAAGTGIGLSMTAAWYLRTSIAAIAISLLVYQLVRVWLRRSAVACCSCVPNASEMREVRGSETSRMRPRSPQSGDETRPAVFPQFQIRSSAKDEQPAHSCLRRN